MMMEAVSDGDAPRDERVHEGVSFGAWAFVLAGVDAGLGLGDLLAHLDLGEEQWQLADEAFNESLLNDVEAGGTLSERLDEAMGEARTSWTRPVPPLDVELRAWLDFHRAWATEKDPIAFLEARRMRASDIHRLHAHWTARLAEDPALRAEALEILEAPPGAVPEPHPEPPRLVLSRIERVATDQTAPRVARAGRALPFTEGDPAPTHPSLSVPLPPPRGAPRRNRADETRVAQRGPDLGPSLPFVAAVDVMVPADEPTILDAEGEGGPRATAEAGDPVSEFTVQRYADLCVTLIESLDREEAVLRRYGLTASQKAELDAYWTQKMSEDITTWLAWDRACAERRAADEEALRA